MAETRAKRNTKNFDETDSLMALLTEYTEKLNSIADIAALGTMRRMDRETLFQKLIPPAQELARFASQQIEFKGLDELRRLELRLRLAEFEAALRSAKSPNP